MIKVTRWTALVQRQAESHSSKCICYGIKTPYFWSSERANSSKMRRGEIDRGVMLDDFKIGLTSAEFVRKKISNFKV